MIDEALVALQMLNLNIIIHSGGGLGLSLILIRLDWTNKKFRFIIKLTLSIS